jgi:hypothetical protein
MTYYRKVFRIIGQGEGIESKKTARLADPTCESN